MGKLARSSTPSALAAASELVWCSIAGTYASTIGTFLLHSTVAQVLSLVKVVLLCTVGLVCLVFPPLWPVLLIWAAYKYSMYRAACSKLLPQWTEKGTPLEDRIRNAVEANVPADTGHFASSDGLKLKYYTAGTGKRHILVCNGVNCSWLLWAPIMVSLSEPLGRPWREEFTVVTWDYRGLYGSEQPDSTAGFSVRALCNDAHDLMKHLGLKRWECVCGWSTGVQVALEFAGLFPDCLDRLFLVNGGHGHTLRFFAQPMPQLVTVGFMSHLVEAVIWLVRFSVCTSPELFESFKARYLSVVEALTSTVFRAMGFLLSNPSLEYTMATNMCDLVSNGPAHCNNVLRILQTLDCHSAAYNLPEVRTPILVVAGLLDWMTPAFTQYEIAALAPRCRIVPFMAGTHHCILEFPRLASREIAGFLTADVDHLAKYWGKPESGGKIARPVAWGLL